MRNHIIVCKLRNGSEPVKPVWRGANLAVHRPLERQDDGSLQLSKLPHWWAITHIRTGFSVTDGGVDATLDAVRTLARQWDLRFRDIVKPEDSKIWRWRDNWMQNVCDCEAGKFTTGPILPNCD